MAGGSELPTSTVQTASADMKTVPAETAKAFLSNVTTAAQLALAQARPWKEMADMNAFAKPENFTDALARIRKNAIYFRTNYSIFVFFAILISLFTSPWSLITLAVLLAAWGYLYLVRKDPLVIMGRVFSEREIPIVMGILTIVAILLSGIGGVVMFALVISGLFCAVHGAFKVPDELFLDEQPSAGPGSGLLSFLSAGGPAVVSHV